MDHTLDSLVAEVATNFKRGTAEMLLLALLRQKDMYAYELSKALKLSSQGLFDIQGPSLYTVLYRLEDRGFVSTWKEQIGRRTRVYYHILPSGEAYLERIKAEYLAVNCGIMAILSAADDRQEE